MFQFPDKSKVAGHGYLGLEGKGLKITAYEIATREVDAMVTVNNLDENTCVPVGEVVSGEMRRKRGKQQTILCSTWAVKITFVRI